MLSLLGLAAYSVGLPQQRRRRRRTKRQFRLYILEYHNVTDARTEPEGTISKERFRRHLRYLARHYEILSLPEAVDRPLTTDVLAITFDDGYRENFEVAWPLLRESGLPASFFVTTGFVDGNGLWFDFARRALETARAQALALPSSARARLTELLPNWLADSLETPIRELKYMPGDRRQRVLDCLESLDLSLPPAAQPVEWSQLRLMASEGADIGGHTHSHPILSTLDDEAQQQEIMKSRDRIATELGAPPTTFAYPNGNARDFNTTSMRLLEELGFKAACASHRGANAPPYRRFALSRIGIGSDSLPVVALRMSGLLYRRPLPRAGDLEWATHA